MLALALILGSGVVMPPALADGVREGECAASVNLFAVESVCSVDGQVLENVSGADGAVVVLVPACGYEGDHCETQCWIDGEAGIYYYVTVDEEDHGMHCALPPEPGEDAEPTPGQVLRAFQRLEWPKSELVIQPPDGKTLVNFDTNFLTENADPTRQRVRLLGQRVVIEAEPTSYVWAFGDGDSLTTETPGARYPDLEVTHKYLKKATYRPSVDTVYTGRYRVNGGPWIQIPETLTVEGDSVELTAIEATPVLVAPDGR